MKRGGPRNIVIQSGDFMTATLEGPSMVDYYGIGFLRHAGMGSFKKMLAWLQNRKKNVENMWHYAKGIMKFQMEIGLPVSSFPDLGLYEIEDNAEETTGLSNNEHHDDTNGGYESEAQRVWRERMEKYY